MIYLCEENFLKKQMNQPSENITLYSNEWIEDKANVRANEDCYLNDSNGWILGAKYMRDLYEAELAKLRMKQNP